MNLPYGVTGFYNSAEEKPPVIDLKKYKELSHGLARKLGGQLVEFEESIYAANFHKAVFQLPQMTLCLVMNSHYPIVAFATAVDAMKIEFIDYPAGNEALPEEFTVFSVSELEFPVPEDIRKIADWGLNKGEIEQVKYWKPETVGQILFNFWD